MPAQIPSHFPSLPDIDMPADVPISLKAVFRKNRREIALHSDFIYERLAKGLNDYAQALTTEVMTTADLPSAGTANDGRIIIEDTGSAANLIIYGAGRRIRITGTAF